MNLSKALILLILSAIALQFVGKSEVSQTYYVLEWGSNGRTCYQVTNYQDGSSLKEPVAGIFCR